jgi:hypothetical protein
MKQLSVSLAVIIITTLSLAAGNTGKIAKYDTNENLDSTCAEGKCRKIVTHRCYCSWCDSTPTGSVCPCVQDNRGLVQQTIYPGQCVEVDIKLSAGYEKEGKGFHFGAEVSGKIKFCMFNSTASTLITTGPVCTT